MVNLELKKAVILYIIENQNLFNRLNNVVNHFNRYIYDENWEFLIWGREIYDRIHEANNLF